MKKIETAIIGTIYLSTWVMFMLAFPPIITVSICSLVILYYVWNNLDYFKTMYTAGVENHIPSFTYLFSTPLPIQMIAGWIVGNMIGHHLLNFYNRDSQ